MSVNTAHANNGVLIHAGEYILLHSDCVHMEFSGQDNPVFKGSKQGRIYLTSHRMIFNNKKASDMMQSFSAPFIALNDVELEQPVFGANYIKGKVRAQPNGNFVGEVKFKLHFKAGGAIEYGQALLRAAKTAQGNMRQGGFSDDPPPYTPSGAWHEAPPPAYQPPPGYYGWLPTHDAFSGPPPNTVFMSDNPPPYPGIGAPPPYSPQQPQHQQQPASNPGWNGFSLPPDEPQQQQGGAGGYQPPPYGASGYGAPGYGAPGYGAPGYSAPAYGASAYGQPGGWHPSGAPQGCVYPGQPGGGQHPPPAGFGYPPAGGAPGGAAASAMGFSAPPANSKEAEALASAFNTVHNQRGNNPNPSDLPPSYNDLPPNYDNANKKDK